MILESVWMPASLVVPSLLGLSIFAFKYSIVPALATLLPAKCLQVLYRPCFGSSSGLFFALVSHRLAFLEPFGTQLAVVVWVCKPATAVGRVVGNLLLCVLPDICIFDRHCGN